MVKIGIITDPQTAPSVRYYRTSGVFHLLEQQTGGQLCRVTEMDQRQFLASETNVFQFNLCLIERPITPGALAAIKHCNEHGVVVWLDYDDNLFQVPAYNNAQDYYSNEENMNLIKQCLSLANIVTNATDHLTRLHKGFNKSSITIPNAWNDLRYPFAEIEEVHKPIRMMWRGSNKHDGDIFEVKSPLSKCIQDPAFEWKFMGYRPFYLNLKKHQYRAFSGVGSYFRTLFTSGLDYLFVPLQINNFNRAKSNCSWIEATIAGACVIAPQGLKEFDRPGVIKYKDGKHLEKIFKEVKTGKYDKRERVEASREELQEKYALSQVNSLRASIIASIFGQPVTEEVKAEEDGTP